MFASRDHEIADILKDAGVLSDEHCSSYLQRAFEQSRDFSECVVSGGFLSEAELIKHIANDLGYQTESEFAQQRLDPEDAGSVFDKKIALKYGVFPIGVEEDTVHLLAMDPFDHAIESDLGHYLNKSIEVYVCQSEEVQQRISEFYPESDIESDIELLDSEGGDKGLGLEQSATIIEYVDTLIQKGIQDGASDLHFEPFEDCFRIRYRVDGNLKEIPSHADHLGQALISRIKVMAQLNIAEARIPQDGRIQVHALGRSIDIRVSTLPTQFGESVVLRILDKTKVNLDLGMLGIPGATLTQLRTAIHSPNGIFLATGPTGSGKTTTLYSALQELNHIESKLLTVEDPVEYDIDGIVQVQTHALIGLDFSRTLRAFLRHDPDKILLGEIRDTETARIAVQASLTGHMVFSSLHTNDAAGAVTRFIDMGVEPYLVAASLVAVLAQRLLRRLDPEHSESYEPDESELSALGWEASRGTSKPTFRRPIRNSRTDLTSGYRGRVGLYEMMTINDRLREAVTSRKSHSELLKIAKENGMCDLRDDGLRAIEEGITSVEEVLRYT